MTHPYEDLESGAFWKTAVTERGAFGIKGLWRPKFAVRPEDRIVTAGSCFAQHIGRALSERGYGWFDAEPAPPFLAPDTARKFNYGIFSFRTGNIYTARMLNQWLDLARGNPGSDEIWRQNGRCYDPMRPAIEPDGFSSEEELRTARAITANAVHRAIEEADLFVFTLGLTESWINRRSRAEYAMCPGTVAGVFDPDLHEFHNANHAKVMRGMRRALRKIREINPDIRILLTVSPVPLTATASGQHVLTASSYSKSVLRAVAGELVQEMPHVDYFPSYEIITHPLFRGMFFAPNQRSVERQGVDTVMGHFFADQETAFGMAELPERGHVSTAGPADQEDVVCEEVMLDAFA